MTMPDVLPDGGHRERSPSAQVQLLAELIAACAREPSDELEDTVSRMRQWLGAMLLPDGDVPIFGDGRLVGPARVADLAPVAPTPHRLRVLPDSGYVIVRPNRQLHLVLDVPSLSFELAIEGRRVAVGSGVSAHKRRPVLEVAEVDAAGIVRITASLVGRRGKPTHRRMIVGRHHSIQLRDEVIGGSHHRAVTRLHVRDDNADAIEISMSPDAVVTPGDAADGLGGAIPATVHTAEVHGPLPLQIRTRLRPAPN
jgi:hypothetical protein